MSGIRSGTANPRLSVVIPTHNRAATVRNAIASVLAQTFQDLEVVVVDDTSTDNTEDVVRSFSDARVAYLRNDANTGPGSSRNRGIDFSRGEFVGFLDDDDEWLPDTAARQLAVLGGSSPQTAGVYCGRFEVLDGGVVGTWLPESHPDLREGLWDHNCLGPPSSFIARRSCLESIGGFDDRLHYGEDWDLYIRLAERYQFASNSEPLIRYTRHAGSLTSKLSHPRRNVERFLTKHGKDLTDKARSNLLMDMGIACCLAGEMRRGRRALLQSVYRDPRTARRYIHLGLSLMGASVYSFVALSRKWS